MTPPSFSLALWATNLEPAVASLDDWVARLQQRMAETRAAGGRLLILPEFACGQWLGFAPPDLALTGQVAWLAQHSEAALARLQPLCREHDLALLAGTLPWPDGTGGHRNRAFLLLPDGRIYHQDKLFLTPSEQDPAGWQLTPGDTVNVVQWAGLRIATAVCLDIESPALAGRLARLDLDLLLVPAKTSLMSGYYRVFSCARARAVELNTTVAVVGAVGTFLGHPASDPVVGGATVYIPCEASLGYTGIAASLEPMAAASGASPLLAVADLPLAHCRRIRHGEAAEAEVCPGAWGVEHLRFLDPAPDRPEVV